MLRIASAFNGYTVAASDGSLGSVSDFFFDDANWQVRWMVVETGNWLSGRKVLLPVSVLGHPDRDKKEFPVRLTRQQVKESPFIDTEMPVSRQMESSVYDYYGWSPYWGTGYYMGGYGFMPGAMVTTPQPSPMKQQDDAMMARQRDENRHLRSVDALTGYHIHANDGEIGHVEDFLIEESDWSIHYLIVDTKNWWPGKKVLISPRSVCEVDWANSLVHLDVDQQTVKDSPEYNAGKPIDRTFENDFHSYYGGATKDVSKPVERL
jgi:sporulation protein YlmC with PRC-barrel domain